MARPSGAPAGARRQGRRGSRARRRARHALTDYQPDGHEDALRKHRMGDQSGADSARPATARRRQARAGALLAGVYRGDGTSAERDTRDPAPLQPPGRCRRQLARLLALGRMGGEPRDRRRAAALCRHQGFAAGADRRRDGPHAACRPADHVGLAEAERAAHPPGSRVLRWQGALRLQGRDLPAHHRGHAHCGKSKKEEPQGVSHLGRQGRRIRARLPE